MSTAPPPRGRKIAALALLFLLTAAVLFDVTTSVAIIHQANTDERRPTDATVVLWAAEYYGRP